MSWISDVRDEVRRLKCTAKELRKFGYLVGSVLILIGGAGCLKHWQFYIVGGIWAGGVVLVSCGFLFPKSLVRVYKVWMGIAFALGWVVSRAILILLFYLVIMPIGMTARLFGKRFIDVNFRRVAKTYWVARGNSKKINYEKMF
jgi:hypothetical protein